MELVWFHLMGILPTEEALASLKESISSTYAHEGQDVVEANYSALDQTLSGLMHIDYPQSWINSTDDKAQALRFDTDNDSSEPDWVKEVARPMLKLEGNTLPVSKMPRGGVVPNGTTEFEHRCIADFVPVWDSEKCIECAQCSFVCSHAAIRPFIASDDEINASPEGFVTKQANAPALKGMHWRIQTIPSGCTGCGSCVAVCPGKALSLQPMLPELIKQKPLYDFAKNKIGYKEGALPRNTVAGSQLFKPLLEFSGACGGCGETPYVKLLTQLMGERIVIANATGCSSIWGANMPSQAYCMNTKGHGPAWGNSLFEDNAEYGFGIATAIDYNRGILSEAINDIISDPSTNSELSDLLKQWSESKEDYNVSYAISDKIKHWVGENINPADATGKMKTLLTHSDLLARKSVWAIGGDGWAFDIGFAGLDHVLASGMNINVLVMDTQCYSNTGGQTSKATPYSACTKYNYNGKRTFKKDLGAMMMTYGNVYVASIALGGNMSQAIKALQEAEAYEGPSIVICYCPCIAHGIKKGMGTSILEERDAVKNSFWPLYRFNPKATPALSVDAKPLDSNITPFLMGENRFAILPARVGTSLAQQMFTTLQNHLDKGKTD